MKLGPRLIDISIKTQETLVEVFVNECGWKGNTVASRLVLVGWENRGCHTWASAIMGKNECTDTHFWSYLPPLIFLFNLYLDCHIYIRSNITWLIILERFWYCCYNWFTCSFSLKASWPLSLLFTKPFSERARGKKYFLSNSSYSTAVLKFISIISKPTLVFRTVAPEIIHIFPPSGRSWSAHVKRC